MYFDNNTGRMEGVGASGARAASIPHKSSTPGHKSGRYVAASAGAAGSPRVPFVEYVVTLEGARVQAKPGPFTKGRGVC